MSVTAGGLQDINYVTTQPSQWLCFQILSECGHFYYFQILQMWYSLSNRISNIFLHPIIRLLTHAFFKGWFIVLLTYSLVLMSRWTLPRPHKGWQCNEWEQIDYGKVRTLLSITIITCYSKVRFGGKIEEKYWSWNRYICGQSY